MLPVSLESSVLDGDLRIGEFVVRPLLKVIRPADGVAGPDEETTLPDKAMAVLVYLAQNARQVCDRDDILDAVWGPEREAFDRVLDNAIREIRRALRDDARNPTYVQTIPKRGYRLLVPVESRLLEKQREVSGEFVPRGHELPVVPRIQRKAGRSPWQETDPESEEHAVLLEPAPDPQPPTGEYASTTNGKTWLLLTAALLVALATGSLLTARSDGVIVALDIEESSRETVMDRAGSAFSVGELSEALHRSLLVEHRCGDRSLYRKDSWLTSHDFRAIIRRGGSGADHPASLLTAEIQPSNLRSVVLFEGDSASFPHAAESFARDVTRQLDQAVCRFEGAPDLERACHCLEGRRHTHATKNLQTTIDDLELAVRLDANLIPAYAELARAFQLTGNQDQGMAVLRTGLARIEDPDDTEALGLRLQLARLLADHKEEERLLEELVERRPDDSRWTLAEASFLAVRHQSCDRAIELLAPLLSQRPHPTATAIEGSLVLWYCGQHERATGLLEEQTRQMPREVESRKRLAAFLSLTGRYDSAERYAKEAMALDPESSDPYWLLGSISESQGQYSAADAWFVKSGELAHWPIQQVRSLIGRARIAWLMGEHERCIDLLGNLEGSPHPEPYESQSWLRGVCLADAGRLDAARTVLEELSVSFAGRADASREGLALYLRGKIDLASATSAEEKQRAASDFVAAAEAHPLRVDFFRAEAGRALMEAGQVDRAQTWFDQALGINPNHPWSLCHRGLLELLRGEDDRALESLRHAVEIFGEPAEDPFGIQCAEELAELRTASIRTH
ncbi:MAG: winged helix-turn-helix domain-containing protein [Thermoanaerobaculia bacterium]|nr:winged helix-turn-helix domain-containing protein [Thermoanaerobaculia bacterium]